MMSRTVRCAPLLICLALFLQGCQTAPVEPEPAPEPVVETPTPEPEPANPVVEPAPEPEPVVPVEVTEPEPVVPPVVVCEPPPARPEPAAPARPKTVLPILGGIEYVSVQPPGLRLKARLDTGANTSSIDARDIREFERDGRTWVKFQLVDRSTEKAVEVSRPVVRSATLRGSNTRRYVVTLKTRIGSIDQFTEFSLVDRSSNIYPVLIGRNYLRDQALVDVARRFTVKNTAK